MNLKKIFFRGESKISVDVVKCWEVRWTSRYGGLYSDTKPQVRLFPAKEGAEQFAKSLDDAFNLIKNTSDNYVTISEQSY